LNRWGVKILDSTLYRWTVAAAEFRIPVYDRMLEIVLSGNYFQVNEIPIKVLQGSESENGTHQDYLWVYNSPPEKIVFFDFR